MESPLLPTSQGDVNESARTKASLFYGQRTVALGMGSTYEKAAALVDKAMDGQGLSSAVLQGLSEGGGKAQFSYFVYHSLEPLWNFNLVVLLLLNFFEVPLWCKGTFPNPCNDSGQYFLSGIPYMSRYTTLYVEAFSAALVLVQVLWPLSYLTRKAFFSWGLDIVQVILAFVLVLDVIFNALYVMESGPINNLPFRAAPYLRVLIIIFTATAFRRMLIIFFKSFSNYLDIGAVLIVFVSFSSLLAFVLFEDTPQGDKIFTSFPETLYRMNVMLQAQKSPDVWIQAFKMSRLSSLFFIVYLSLGLFFVMNLLLAVIYDSFKERMGEDYERESERQQKTVEYAFELLDSQGRGYLTFVETCQLLVELNRYRILPLVKGENFNDIFTTMDDSHDRRITKDEFMDVCRIIGLKFKEPPEEMFLAIYTPKLWDSRFFTKVREFVKSSAFERLIWGVLVLNLATVVVETSLDVSDSKLQYFWVPVEHVIGWIYVVEMLLKVSVLGFKSYWKDGRNRFDFVITILILAGELLLLLAYDKIPVEGQEWIRYLLVARLLRLTRLLTAFPRYRVIFNAFLRLLPGLTPLISLLFFTVCLFSSLGTQLYGGLLYYGHPKLDGTDYDNNDYYVTNFNDFPAGLVLLFNVLVTSGDPAWTDAVRAVTGHQWTPVLFFQLFYYICISYVLQLVASFVLEAFFVEKEILERSLESTYQKTEEGIEYEVGSSNRAHQMLGRVFGRSLDDESSL